MSNLNLNIAIGSFVACTIMMSGAITDAGNAPSFLPVLSGGIGTKRGTFGGITGSALNKKDDPFAFYTHFPQDFSVDASGKIIIADTANHRIVIYGPDGKVENSVNVCGNRKFKWPFRVVPTRNGLFVGEESNGMLYALNIDLDCLYSVDLFSLDDNIDVEEIFIDNEDELYVETPVENVYRIAISNVKTIAGMFHVKAIGTDYKGDIVAIIPDGFEIKKITPVKCNANYRIVKLIGVRKNGNAYLLVSNKHHDYLVILDKEGNEQFRMKAEFNGYKLTRWVITKSDEVYAMGIDGRSKTHFLKIFKVIF